MKIKDILGITPHHKRHRGPRKPRTISGRDLVGEAEGKNTHLDHAEELVFIYGRAGVNRLVTSYKKLLDQLDGKTAGDAITTKWDGSPAIFCGIDPADGRFFVGTKGVFAKNAKLNKSQRDINRNHPDVERGGETIDKSGLREKLSTVLRLLPKLGITGVLQGDLLYTRDDLRMVNIDGVRHVAFKPNTITYTVPAASALGKRILSSQMGIVFHTSYSGSSIEDMTATFGYDASDLPEISSIWVTDAIIRDVSSQVNLDPETVNAIKTAINDLKNTSPDANAFKLLDSKLGLDLVVELKAHANTPIRNGQALESDPDTFAQSFIDRIKQKYVDAIAKLKTGPTGPAAQKKTEQMNAVVQFLEQNKNTISQMYSAYFKASAIKMMFQRQMRHLKAIDSFIEQPNGDFKVTDPEGFVIVSNNGRAMKIVDRLEFSAANFAK